MAFLGQLAKGAGSFGDALNLADSLFQNQVSIQDKDEKDQIYLNVTESVMLTLQTIINEQPVADQGGVVDYVSRTSTPLVITGILSNRNLDLRRDPLGIVASHAAAYAPAVFGAIKAAVSVGSKFFDLGKDEIDKKITTLAKWQNDVVLVKVKGAKIDLKKYSDSGDEVYYLIDNISVSTSVENGDAVAVSISLKNLLALGESDGGAVQGSSLLGKLGGALKSLANPF
jgi:hypothetical protein